MIAQQPSRNRSTALPAGLLSLAAIAALTVAALAIAVPAHASAQGAAGTVTVGYLSLAPEKTREDSAVAAWLSSDQKFSPRVLDLGTGLPDLSGIGVLWIHIPDSADYERWRPHLAELAPLKPWYEGGGRFLFTGLAAMLPHEIGIERVAPAIEAQEIENDWLFDQKGFQGFRPDISAPGGAHPVFAGLFGGTFTWDTDSSHRLWCAGYFGGEWPADGKVVAVEKAYITISGDRKLVVEYRNGKGRGLAAGGYLFYAGPNHWRENLRKFVENSLEYVAGDGATPSDVTAYWNRTTLTPAAFDPPQDILDTLAAGRKMSGPSKEQAGDWAPSDLVIRRDSTTRNFYDVAGRGAVAMGKEAGGIDEVWTHPFRLLRDYRAGIVAGDTVAWLDEMPARLEIRPEGLTRTWSTPAGALKEVVFTPAEEPAVVVHYELSGTGRGKLVVKFRSDLRQMWPYDAPATGSLGYAFDSGGAGPILMVRDEPGLSWGMFGADRAAPERLAGAFDSVWWNAGAFGGAPTGANQVWYAAAYELAGGAALNIVMAGGSDGGPRTASRLAGLLANPAAAHAAARRSTGDLLARSVSIDSPDDEFDRLFEWAIVGTDRFLVNTPGVGKGLLAGYSTTARGWDGAQKVSGRPGYAWYFGRDAAWSGFAVDDYGDFAAVRAELELMQKYQDASGKIFHEISTSGSVHYDASDATPLYVQLAAHYLRASGDTAFLRASWRNINRAMQYLQSTDTDHDKLIENTNHGHGWVEGGALYPVHTEFYLAGAWGKALLDAAYIASTLRDRVWNQLYAALGTGVREILNRDFWNPRTKFFNLGKKVDGTYNTEPTVLPATVMYYGLLDDEKAKPVLEQYAGAGFSTDWGVRIVSSASPFFNPSGYHYGSVWPLFTGWTALAEYEYGKSTQGFTHILNNLYIKNHWALGFVEEVMSGAVYQPSGVCPHQCWSETNILHPAITGMIGWKPDAPAHAAGLYPRFPVQWDSVKVRNLRAGPGLVDVAMVRAADRTAFTFSARGRGPITLSFAPEIPEGMKIRRILLDGKEIPVPAGRRRGLLDPPIPIVFSGGSAAAAAHTLVLEHTGGIGVVPAMPRPEPGDSSTGHRIVSEEMRDGVYEIKIEGRAGTTAEIEVRTFDRALAGVENASIAGEVKKGVYKLGVVFPAAPEPYVTVTVKARTD